MNIYINDVIVKSKTLDQHILDLKVTLNTLKRFCIKLNPKKCAEIEAILKKIKVVLHTLSPKIVKEVQKLTDSMTAL